MRVEMSEELASRVQEIAQEQGRSVAEVLEEAVRVYLESRRVFSNLSEAAGSETDVAAWINNRPEESAEELSRDGFLALLGRMTMRFDLGEDAAMRIALEEQRAYRAERSERERAKQ